MSVHPQTRAEGSRILVAGSDGFVGRHLCKMLALRGCRVVTWDRPDTSADITADLSDAALDPDALWNTVGPVDAIVFLAANISRTSSVDAAARRNLRVIAEAPVRVLEAAAARGQRPHLVYCSTFKLYGPPRQPLIDPESHPQRPEPWSYGSAKALAERLLAIASARARFTYAVVRPTCIFGPGQHLRNAIPVFLQTAWRGESPTVFGSGTSVRDDVFVSDLVEILAEVAVRRVCGVMHAGGERARTILEVAQLCCDAVAQAGGPKGLQPQCDTSKPPKPWLDQRFDITSTRRQLGYAPTAMANGLAAEAAWIRAGARREDAVQDWFPQNDGQAQGQRR